MTPASGVTALGPQLEDTVLFACLHIRRPRRLNHLRRLAFADAPVTATRLPGRLLPDTQYPAGPVPARLPDGFHPADPVLAPVPAGPAPADAAERGVRAWLHTNQVGRCDLVTSPDETGDRR
ncbi:hypothetical protein OHU11_42145 (plasmid) [Streptomyces sp. NBC_00257]|uniref:hypothetical protein n=1 Tax=unclassified Streptomyces TaxID=2593676 RepID=UPI00224D2F01|nr:MULTISPECIES: hypothetical protein [unclassified Streptomyces]MCX5434783.1 hypothetical protein [Streptomyces sp. NBC_00062]